MKLKLKLEDVLITYRSCSYLHVRNIEIEDLNEDNYVGLHGSLYKCISIDSKVPNEPLLIKILNPEEPIVATKGYNTIRRIQNKIFAQRGNWENLGYELFTDIPAFKAFPIFSFKTLFKGSIVYGYVAQNLNHLGFVQFETVLNPLSDEYKKYTLLSVSTRLQFCFHLAKGFEFLKICNYIHADVNPKNLFVNLQTGMLTLIDFDGGGVLESTIDTASVNGKLADAEWLAPELYDGFLRFKMVEPSQFTEMWSVAVAIHYLLFHIEPFFFLVDSSYSSVSNYLQNNSLYPVNFDDINVGPYAIVYENYVKFLNDFVPMNIHRELMRNFEDGFSSDVDRTSFAKWVNLISPTQEQPVIESFISSMDVIIAGASVKLRWIIRNAQKVTFGNELKVVTGINQLVVKPIVTTIYTIKAIGTFGEVEKDVCVTVLPIPVIQKISVPIAAPQFNVKDKICSIDFFSKPKINFKKIELTKLTLPTLVSIDKDIIVTKLRSSHSNKFELNSFSNILKNLLIKINKLTYRL